MFRTLKTDEISKDWELQLFEVKSCDAEHLEFYLKGLKPSSLINVKQQNVWMFWCLFGFAVLHCIRIMRYCKGIVFCNIPSQPDQTVLSNLGK